MFDDIFSPEAQAQRAAEQALQAEQERHAVCQLLRHRGHEGAALIVAAGQWRADCVDNWDGGQFEVEIAVRPECYDAASDEVVLAELRSAAEAVVGKDHFRGVTIALMRGAAPPGWDVEMIDDIIRAERGRHAPKSLGVVQG